MQRRQRTAIDDRFQTAVRSRSRDFPSRSRFLFQTELQRHIFDYVEAPGAANAAPQTPEARLKEKLFADFGAPGGRFTARLETSLRQYVQQQEIRITDAQLTALIRTAIDEQVRRYHDRVLQESQRMSSHEQKEAEIQRELAKSVKRSQQGWDAHGCRQLEEEESSCAHSSA